MAHGPLHDGDVCSINHGDDPKDDERNVEGFLAPGIGDGFEVEERREKPNIEHTVVSGVVSGFR